MMLREPWRTRLLFMSVAGNLFALALIGANLMHRAPYGRPHGPPGAEAIIDRLARDLPHEDAERFRASMALGRAQFGLAHQRMEAARDTMALAIGRTPFDEAEVRKAMRDLQASWIAWSDSLGDSLVRTLPTLSPDGRGRLAEAGHRRPSP
ncbi:MAG: hypothetical protein NVSMB18_09560 [Acetobacteraceae bacterium]